MLWMWSKTRTADEVNSLTRSKRQNIILLFTLWKISQRKTFNKNLTRWSFDLEINFMRISSADTKSFMQQDRTTIFRLGFELIRKQISRKQIWHQIHDDVESVCVRSETWNCLLSCFWRFNSKLMLFVFSGGRCDKPLKTLESMKPFMLFICLVIKWMLELCLPKKKGEEGNSLLFETRSEVEINLWVGKQRRFVEHAVIRVQMYFHPPALLFAFRTHTHIVDQWGKKAVYER